MVSINFKSLRINCHSNLGDRKPDFTLNGIETNGFVKKENYGDVFVSVANYGVQLPTGYSPTLEELCKPIGNGKDADKLPSEEKVRKLMPKIIDEFVEDMRQKALKTNDDFEWKFSFNDFKRQLLSGFEKTEYRKEHTRCTPITHRVDFIYPREEKS